MEDVKTTGTNIDRSTWKRLGITQAFDLLLVKACLEAGGTEEDLKCRAGRELSGGALKFWEMSFSELVRDLTRQDILLKEDDILGLHPDFSDRLTRTQQHFEEQVSRVVLNENVSLEQIEARAKARAARATKPKAKSVTSSSRASRVGPAKRAAVVDPSGTEDLSAPSAAATDQASGSTSILNATPRHSSGPKAPVKIFTSIRMNRLLDRLDNSSLSKNQLGTRLDLSGSGLERFFHVCEANDLIRIVRSDFVELHWRGREFARTADAERRMAVLGLVKELRAYDSAAKDAES